MSLRSPRPRYFGIDVKTTKRILLTCNSSFGLANFRMGLIRRLLSEGFEVIAAAPRDDHSQALKEAGVEFHDWHLSARSTNPFSELTSLVQLIGIYHRTSPDICFHYTVKAVIYGALAASIVGTRFVSVITGLGYIFLNDSPAAHVARRLYKLLLGKSFRVWFLNQTDLDEFVHFKLVSSVLAEVIPGEGVDTKHFVPAALPQQRSYDNGDACQFVMVSRLLSDKGIVEFIDAIRILRQGGHRLRALILGGRGDENPTAIPDDFIDAWVNEGLIEYPGKVADVRPFVGGADCVVLPSYREGLPRALLEASAMAVPVIATNVPGCRDVVIDGANGYLCEARSAEALAATMERFMALSGEGRREMGRKGREFVCEKFDESVVQTRYMSLLSTLE